MFGSCGVSVLMLTVGLWISGSVVGFWAVFHSRRVVGRWQGIPVDVAGSRANVAFGRRDGGIDGASRAT